MSHQEQGGNGAASSGHTSPGHKDLGRILSDRVLDASPPVEQLLHQQAVLADFGRLALVEDDLDRILNDGARLCAEATGVEYCKVLRLLPGGQELLVCAGYGWGRGVVGKVRAPASGENPCGRALHEERPIVDVDVRANPTYHLPSIYDQYRIVSTINMVVLTDSGPFGVLEIDTDEKRRFTIADVNFMTAFAHMMGDAISRIRRTGTDRGPVGMVLEAFAAAARGKAISVSVRLNPMRGEEAEVVVEPVLSETVLAGPRRLLERIGGHIRREGDALVVRIPVP